MCNNSIRNDSKFKLFAVKRRRPLSFEHLTSIHPEIPIIISEKQSNRVQEILSPCTSNTSLLTMSCTDNYKMACKTLSPNLARAVGMETDFVTEFDTSSDWKPPSTHGLGNSTRIFGDYYFTGKQLHGKIFTVDFYSTIIDDIRNLRKLSYYQLCYINELDSDDKQRLIEHYDECIGAYEKYF